MCTKSLTILAGAFSMTFLLPPEGLPRTEESGPDQYMPVPSQSERQAKRAFDQLYAALDRMYRGELDQLNEAWSHSSQVTYMGPFGGRQVGWDRVHAEFKREAAMNLKVRLIPENMIIRVTGDFAYVLCVEREIGVQDSVQPSDVYRRATNIFLRDSGKWKLVHRQTDKTPVQQSPPSE